MISVSRPRNARADAERVLDDVSTLNMRRTLGPERWDKLLREASASLEAAKIQDTGAQTHKKVNRRVWLSDAFDRLPPQQQRAELRTLVRCVMVEAGEGPLADRVHVLLADNPVELPRQGVPRVARRWTPEDPSPAPPRRSPNEPPAPAIAPKIPNAFGRSGDPAKVADSSARAEGASRAPKAPCRARAATSIPNDWDRPPSADAPAKPTRPATKVHLRPKRSPSLPPSSSRLPNASA